VNVQNLNNNLVMLRFQSVSIKSIMYFFQVQNNAYTLTYYNLNSTSLNPIFVALVMAALIDLKIRGSSLQR
jgi:hypothetical protein